MKIDAAKFPGSGATSVFQGVEGKRLHSDAIVSCDSGTYRMQTCIPAVDSQISVNVMVRKFVSQRGRLKKGTRDVVLATSRVSPFGRPQKQGS